MKTGDIITVDNRTYIVLKINKKTVKLREIFLTKNGFKTGDFYKADII